LVAVVAFEKNCISGFSRDCKRLEEAVHTNLDNEQKELSASTIKNGRRWTLICS
jgi:hypothetical protein